MMTLEEQIEYAKSFVGKKILGISGEVSGLVDEYEVLTKKNYDDRGYESDNSRVNTIFKQQPVIVVLRGTWDSAYKSRMVRSINPLKKDIMLLKKKVNINGFFGVDEGSYFKFGCAKIKKTTLEHSRDLMTSFINKGVDDYKYITGIRIGDGLFTLKDLNDLLDDSD